MLLELKSDIRKHDIQWYIHWNSCYYVVFDMASFVWKDYQATKVESIWKFMRFKREARQEMRNTYIT